MRDGAAPGLPLGWPATLPSCPACPRVAHFLFSSSISSFYYCSILLISGGTEIVNPVGTLSLDFPPSVPACLLQSKRTSLPEPSVIATHAPDPSLLLEPPLGLSLGSASFPAP